MDKNISDFFKNDPGLMPFVERICKERPDIDDPYTIEEIANVMYFSPKWAAKHSIDEIWEKAEHDLDSMKDYDEPARVVKATPGASEKLIKLNVLGVKLCKSNPLFTLGNTAEPNPESGNATLYIDAKGGICGSAKKADLELLSQIFHIADDFTISSSERGLRLSFGVQKVLDI